MPLTSRLVRPEMQNITLSLEMISEVSILLYRTKSCSAGLNYYWAFMINAGLPNPAPALLICSMMHPFEVVCVPVLRYQTIDLDTRCVHAGASWTVRACTRNECLCAHGVRACARTACAYAHGGRSCVLTECERACPRRACAYERAHGVCVCVRAHGVHSCAQRACVHTA